MVFLLVLSYIVFQFTRYIQKRNAINGISNYLWLLQLFSIFLILLFGEFALSQTIFDLKYSNWGELNRTEINVLMLYTGYIIAILWWVIPAYYISSAVDQFLWKPIQHRTQAKIPAVLRLFIITIIYMLAVLGIMAFVFKVTVAGLAATSGMIALLFAFASKVDLSNIIAGLGISFSRIFKLGDWVNINDSIDGKIIELTPRSTNILTADASIISVPNTVVSKAIIKNYNRPNNNFRLEISLEVMINDDKAVIEKILLHAVSSVEGVLITPTAIIRCNGQDKDSIQIYDILFYVDNYEQRHFITENVWRSIARVLKSSRICLDKNFLLEQNKNS
jgi:small-conductance mechanosensitive channel